MQNIFKSKMFIFFSIFTFLILVACGVLGYSYYVLGQEKQEQVSTNARITSELDSIKATLSSTEEGRKQLELANKNVSDQNKQLETRATSAESQVSSVQAQLANAQTQLNSVNASLGAKQAELDRANRGVALFNTVTVSYNSFQANITCGSSYWDLASAAYDSGDMDLGDSYMAQSDACYNYAFANYNDIFAILAQFTAGNY